MLSVILSPFVFLLILPSKTQDILDFIESHTDTVEGIGDVCSLSMFNLPVYGDTKYGAPAAQVSRGDDLVQVSIVASNIDRYLG
jgi:autophagy-related protein 9